MTSTLVMIKPDAQTRNLKDRISEEIILKGLEFLLVGHAVFNLEIVQEFYRWETIKCPDVVDSYLCHKPIPVWIVFGPGATEKAMEIKWRLRRTLCDGSHENLMHCSSSQDNFIWEYGVLKKHGLISVNLEHLKV